MAVVGHPYCSTERSYQAVIIQISSGPKLLLKVSSIPSALRLWTHDNIRWHVPTNSARSGEEILPEKRNSLKVITSITTILHDHAIVVDVQNGEFWELKWINVYRRTRVIASTSNVCRLRLLVLHRVLNAALFQNGWVCFSTTVRRPLEAVFRLVVPWYIGLQKEC